MGLIEEIQRQGQFLFRWRSYLPLLFVLFMVMAVLLGRPEDIVWQNTFAAAMVCLSISIVGLVLRIYTVGHVPGQTSGRNTKKQVAEKLNTTGMYSVVRHPLYLGNYLVGLGMALYTGIWWMGILYSLTFYLYYERIMVSEEEFLRERFGDPFERWSAATPAFFPRFSSYRRPDLPFCPRTAMRREYPGITAIFLSFTLLDMTLSYSRVHVFNIHPYWKFLLFSGAIAYLTLRTLKRRTRILHVEGR